MDNSRCEQCAGDEEINLHAIRDCVKAKKVWSHFIPPNLIQKIYSLPLKDRVPWKISSERMHNFNSSWKVKIFVIC